MTRCELHSSHAASIWKVAVGNGGYPQRGDALRVAKQRAVSDDPVAAIIHKDTDAVYVATWGGSNA